MSRLPAGRCRTHEDRRAVVEALLTAWDRSPNLRLGQLIDNLIRFTPGPDLFQIEDDKLRERFEAARLPR